MDKITLERIKLIHPDLEQELTTIYSEICAKLTGRAICRFAYTLRTFDEQNKLYAQGRTIKGKIVTNAKSGQSFHNYSLAVDVVLIIDGKESSWDMLKDFDGDKIADWMEIVQIFKKYSWFWGGEFSSFKDYPHFEKTFGFTTEQLMFRYNNKPIYKEVNGVKYRYPSLK